MVKRRFMYIAAFIVAVFLQFAIYVAFTDVPLFLGHDRVFNSRQFARRPTVTPSRAPPTPRDAFKQCIYLKNFKKPQFQPPSRDFTKSPIRIGGADVEKIQEIECAIPCFHYPHSIASPQQKRFGSMNSTKPPSRFDASFVDHLVLPQNSDESSIKPRLIAYDSTRKGLSVLRTMESPAYYPATELSHAKKYVDIVMTPRLDSDVPVPYFSWVLHDFMKQPRPKSKDKPLASAFISNCHAKNFRLEAAVELQKMHPKIGDFYGSCFVDPDSSTGYANIFRPENGTKEDAMAQYKFYLAFENSNEFDYVTEKFYQSLVEGTVPVVIGAPNIRDFEPAENSLLHIRSLSDVDHVAQMMQDLGNNDDLYSKMMRWKETGPSAKFLALIDLAIVHSSCRLCIHVADIIRRQERFDQQCYCSNSPVDLGLGNFSSSVDLTKFFVRERGLYDFLEIHTIGAVSNLTQLFDLVLMTFKTSTLDGYWPIWTRERDETGRRPNVNVYYRQKSPSLKIHRIYEVGKTQREVLYGNAAINTDAKVANLFGAANQCLYLEVIFV